MEIQYLSSSHPMGFNHGGDLFTLGGLLMEGTRSQVGISGGDAYAPDKLVLIRSGFVARGRTTCMYSKCLVI